MRAKTAKRLRRLATCDCIEKSVQHHLWRRYYQAMKRWWQTVPRPLRGNIGAEMRRRANERMEADDA